MLFGVVIGTYSSIFIAAPILIYLGVKFTQEEREAGTTAPVTKGGAPSKA